MNDVILNLEAVDKFYGPIDQGVHAVCNISMQVSSGEIRAPSTASLLSFLEDLAEGRIPSPSTPTSMSLYLGRRRRW